jgi:hypothetical protein
MYRLHQARGAFRESAIVRRAAQQTGIVTATPTPITWDAEDRDISGWITVPDTDLVVPNGMGGLYIVVFEAAWVGDAQFVQQRYIRLSLDGTIWGNTKYDVWKNNEHPMVTTAIAPLEAGDVIQGIVEHTEAANKIINTARLVIARVS